LRTGTAHRIPRLAVLPVPLFRIAVLAARSPVLHRFIPRELLDRGIHGIPVASDAGHRNLLSPAAGVPSVGEPKPPERAHGPDSDSRSIRHIDETARGPGVRLPPTGVCPRLAAPGASDGESL